MKKKRAYTASCEIAARQDGQQYFVNGRGPKPPGGALPPHEAVRGGGAGPPSPPVLSAYAVGCMSVAFADVSLQTIKGTDNWPERVIRSW